MKSCSCQKGILMIHKNKIELLEKSHSAGLVILSSKKLLEVYQEHDLFWSFFLG